MQVITNNTPLRYLIFLEYDTIFPALFAHLVVPQAVVQELQQPKTPPRVRTWMAAPPSWLEVRQPVSRPDAALQRLGAGERDTLLLAQELQADLVLLDDREAHAEAARRGVPTFGTLRLLEMAAQRHLLDLPTALTALAATSFYVEESLVRDLLARDAARKRQGL